jgi:hypothetical protein
MQLLLCSGTQYLYLPNTPPNGTAYFICNVGGSGWGNIEIRNYAGTKQCTLAPNQNVWIAYDSSIPAWRHNQSMPSVIIGQTISGDSSGNAVTIGYNADTVSPSGGSGTAVGYNAKGGNYGVAIGSEAVGTGFSVAIGRSSSATASFGVSLGCGATSSNLGIALGANSNATAKNFSIAKGFYSKVQRWNEEVKSSDGADPQKYSYSTLAWHGETTNDTQTELFLGGTANQRCTVLASSAFGFSIYVTAKDNVNSKGKRWKLEGMIQRNGSNVTSLVGSVTPTVITQSDYNGTGTDTWNIVALADDINEALVLKFTGEASKTIRIIARGEIEECRF